MNIKKRLTELAARSGALVEFAKREIDVDDIHGNYIEHPGRKRHIVGGVAGAVIGAGLGGLASAKLRAPIHLPISVGGAAGAVSGSFLADPHGSKERRRQMKEGHAAIRDAFLNDSVPVETIKSNVPIASSYGQVARELKKQKVGFFKRHAAALASGGSRGSNHNAAFLPIGEQGVIVTPKKVPHIIVRHEGGHAEDYKRHGDFEKIYPRYGQETWKSRDFLQNTLLPEERAWRHARPRTEKEKKLRDAALGTYASVGGFTRKQTT